MVLALIFFFELFFSCQTLGLHSFFIAGERGSERWSDQVQVAARVAGDQRGDWPCCSTDVERRVAMSGASGGSTHAPTRCLYVSPLKGE